MIDKPLNLNKKYDFKEYYYPYIKDDIANLKHTRMIKWLINNFGRKKFEIGWENRFDPKNLYIYFDAEENLMFFKLMWYGK